MEPKSTMTPVDPCGAGGARPARTRERAGAFRAAFATVWLVPVIIGAHASAAEPGERPADPLLRLVAPDAAIVLTVEGLRDKVRAFTGSRLAADLRQLPVVRAWLESEKYQQFEQSRAQIEAVLGANLTDLRDELLGDAVVLALRLPPEGPADSSLARGLLLFQARDQALLERLIRVVNTTQKDSGELAQVGDRQRAGTAYHVREFPAAAGRLPEWYVAYPDGTFAFSNSELLIQAVIDRKTSTQAAQNVPREVAGASAVNDSGAKIEPGLGDLPKLHSVQRRLPEPALARLFVDPRHIGRLLAAAPRPAKPRDARLMAMLERYLAAVDYAGAALVWNDRAIVLHTVETLDPSRLDSWLRRWAGGTRRLDPALERVPSTALALASGQVDALAFYDALSQLVPNEDGPKMANIETILTGLLLGQDLRTRILPRMGPGVLAYLDSPSETDEGRATGVEPSPGSSWPFPLVAVVSLRGDERGGPRAGGARPTDTNAGETASTTVLAALENALRTVLALTAMDEKRNGGRSRILTRVVAGATVTTLDPFIPFAYAFDGAGSRLVVGTSADSVARYLESSSDPKAGERFRRLQAAAFPGDETFCCVDFDALNKLAGRHRKRLVQSLAARKQRPAADVDRDLTQVLALARLFEAAFVTSRFEPDATAVQRRVGLILHDQGGK
ncbi:MAG: hypothetical protein ACHRXM_12825 [Isosphaerales bacterium]